MRLIKFILSKINYLFHPKIIYFYLSDGMAPPTQGECLSRNAGGWGGAVRRFSPSCLSRNAGGLEGASFARRSVYDLSLFTRNFIDVIQVKILENN